MTRRAILLDRDGTLNARPAPHEYVTSPGAFEWLPGAAVALGELAGAGYVLAVASNQRGIARGSVTPGVLRAIEQRVQADLRPYGAQIAAFAYCPHELDAGCDCRKPKPGLLRRLAEQLDLELASSWMVGDSPTDVEAGRAAGCRTALLGAGECGAAADLLVASLPEFSRRLLRSAGLDSEK